MRNAHVGEELLAYLDGELDPASRARVEVHLRHCPQCAAELEQLRELRRGVGTTLDTAFSSVRLSHEADDRIREVLLAHAAQQERMPFMARFVDWVRGLWASPLPVAQAALAVMVLFFSINGLRVLSLSAPTQAQEVLLLGERRLAPGSQGAFRVIVRDMADGELPGPGDDEASDGTGRPDTMPLALAGSPVAGASVVVSLLTDSGRQARLFSGSTDALGTVDAVFTVPEIPEGRAELVVETASSAGTGRLTQSIDVARTYKIFLMSDKPAYRPGQVVNIRGLVLDAGDLRPVNEGALHWVIRDADGVVVGRGESDLSVYGVGTWTYELPLGLTQGDYQVTASLGDTSSDRTFQVSAYELPPFRLDLSIQSSYLVPGESLVGTVQAEYFFGMPVREGTVTILGYLPNGADLPVVEATGLTDDDGTFGFDAALPSDLPSGELLLVVELVDLAGSRTGTRRVLPLSSVPVLVEAMPESGVLEPGVENVIILMTTAPDGQPIAADLAVTLQGETQRLRTDRYGLTSLVLVPTGDTEIDIVARDSSGAETRTTRLLKADDPETSLLLHLPQATYDVGDTLVAKVWVAGTVGDIVYLDVVRAGQMVLGLASPVEDGAASYAVDLDPSLVGTLELRAYVLDDSGQVAQDTRLVVVDAPEAIDVAITSDRARYAPSDVAHLEFHTSEASGSSIATPKSAVLGISVVDESVYALDALPPGFARTYMLIDEQLLARRGQVAALDLPSLLAAEDGALQAQDLAARAAWAGAAVAEPSLQVSEVMVAPDESSLARRRAVDRLLIPLTGLPLGALLLVVGYLHREELIRRALKRLVVVVLVLLALSPVLLFGVVIGLLLPWLGTSLFFTALAVVVALLLVALVHGFKRRWGHLKFFVILLIAYLVLVGLTLLLAAGIAGPAGWQLGVLVVAFLVLCLSILLEGQLLLLQSSRTVGWSTTALVLALVILALTAPTVPALRSNVARAMGNPMFYVGPLGWLSGCSAAMEPEAPMEPEEAVSETAEEAEMPAPTPALTPAGTAMPAPTATPAPLPLPAEPYPLRQIFPDTLYWDPEAQTDGEGYLALDLPLADSITAWRVTALASTLEGAIGAASVPLTVTQDLVLDVVAPERVAVGELVTVTLRVYNTTAMDEPISWRLPDVGSAAELQAPQPLVVPPRSGASTTWIFRPASAGALSLDIQVLGTEGGDRVLVEVRVVR